MIVDADEALGYPTEYFEEVDDRDDEEYLAFLYDEQDKPVGTLSGANLDSLMHYLKEHSNKTKRRYVLVQVLESYEGQTVH